MINNDTAKSTYTVTEGVTEYPIGFQYTTNPDGTPNLYVWYGDNTELEYGTGYTLSDDGLSIVLLSPVEADETLTVAVDEPFIQDSDYVIGRIDPEQIEKDFDKSVLRDLELRDYADDINDRLADEVQARTDADAALQDAIDTKQDIIADLATIRSGAAAGATAVQPSDLSSVATSGSYNDLSDKPTIPDTSNMQLKSNLVTSVSAASTDVQYPSAKLFYDTCGDIETLINAL